MKMADVAYTSRSQFITEGIQCRNSIKDCDETLLTGLLNKGLLGLISYTTQDYLTKHGTTKKWARPFHIN